jgi:hypothetical protein
MSAARGKTVSADTPAGEVGFEGAGPGSGQPPADLGGFPGCGQGLLLPPQP